MRIGFYARLALSNLRKNYRFFVPRILSEAGLLSCFFIALTLATDSRLAHVKGGSYIPTFMWMGSGVLAVLSAVLRLYTDSFLMKQRRQELGLYNVLGMEKCHVSRVLLHESLLSSALSVALGLGLGILFYKLCSLLICRLLQAEVIIGLYFLSPLPILISAGFFLLLDALICILNRISIARMKPVELLSSRRAGEREPRVKWPMLVLGALSLAAGYWISVTTQSPLEALPLFFIAVVLVIAGTYFLFISGSIYVLKTLKKREKFYYTPRHMPAVSGLLYRMKQNAVGLASVAILATGVLVMISTTVSLYAGLEGILARNYPDHLYVSASYQDEDHVPRPISADVLEETVRAAADKSGLEIAHIIRNPYLCVSYLMRGNTFLTASEAGENGAIANLCSLIFITQDTYRELTGESPQLTGHEVAVCRISSSVGNTAELKGSFTLHGENYTVVKNLTSFPVKREMTLSGIINTYGIVLSGEDVLAAIDTAQRAAYFDAASERMDRLAIRFTDERTASDAYDALARDISEAVETFVKDNGYSGWSISIDSLWSARESLLGMYGTLLFLGILLGAVCLFATVLIIYFKQISEGYEDRDRFRMMEKIGMSRQEVKKTVGRQVLTVFFLPLITAGIHFLFAYPILQRMLKIMMLDNPSLFLICSLITYGVFALVYWLIYNLTSRTYCKIVQ